MIQPICLDYRTPADDQNNIQSCIDNHTKEIDIRTEISYDITNNIEQTFNESLKQSNIDQSTKNVALEEFNSLRKGLIDNLSTFLINDQLEDYSIFVTEEPSIFYNIKLDSTYRILVESFLLEDSLMHFTRIFKNKKSIYYQQENPLEGIESFKMLVENKSNNFSIFH